MECPCIQDMKNGPCGPQFVAAYRCFLDSSQVAAADGQSAAHRARRFVRSQACACAAAIIFTPPPPSPPSSPFLQELRGSDCVSQFKEMQVPLTPLSRPSRFSFSPAPAPHSPHQACMMLHPEHYKVTFSPRHAAIPSAFFSRTTPQRFLEDDEDEEERADDSAGDGAAAEKDVTKEAVKK
jgi:hypothetical protein